MKYLLFYIILFALTSSLFFIFSKINFLLFLKTDINIIFLLIFTYLVLLFLNLFTIFTFLKRKNRFFFKSLFLLSLLPLVFSVFTKTFINSIILFLTLFLNSLFITYNLPKRTNLFTKFKPNEMFLPILKTSFLLFTLGLIVLSSFQSLKLLEREKNLLTPEAFLKITKPFVPIINKQLSIQIEDAFRKKLGNDIGIEDRQQAIRLIISEILETMSEGEIRKRLGFRPDIIPVDKIEIYETGEINIEPALQAASPVIVKHINLTLQNYHRWLALIVILLIAVILFPIMWLFDLITLIITPLFFFLLFKISLLKKTKVYVEIEKVE